MQHVVAQALEAGTPAAVPAKVGVSGTCMLLEFSNPEEEAERLSDMIEEGILAKNKSPRDFCILVRQRAGDMIQQLKVALANKNINCETNLNSKIYLLNQL